jgi:sucrose phosphorylase
MNSKCQAEKQTEHHGPIKIRYNPDPDYAKSLPEISVKARKKMLLRLSRIYGEEKASAYFPELERIIKMHHAHKPQQLIDEEQNFDPKERFTEKDMVLIAYGDIINGEGLSPLATLHKFVNTYNRGAINTLHILPFFPYSSDRGFSVIDFRQVDPKLGTWEDIANIGGRYNLMFDGVLNHCSSRSSMFLEFLNGHPKFKDFFIAYDSPDDLTPDQRSKIFRPRTSDILTQFYTINGPKHVWTTFSKDQIDLNFRNPEVLMRVIEGLLFYVRNGAGILRLDAVTYIWAEPGTDCVHLPETHEIIKLLRDAFDVAAPGVAIITETNVPHEDNISYFGNGYDESRMVYNFALPPMVLHAFYSESAVDLSKWARTLKAPSELTTFFNMLDTHDGIGLMGVRGILSKEDIDLIIRRAGEHGAFISYKMGENRVEEPYEINTTWWSAINKDDSDEDMALQVRRYLASRSISLVLQGVPALYVHGALGTANDHDLAQKTRHKRDINRGVVDSVDLVSKLEDPHSKISLIRAESPKLYLTRTKERAFHPRGEQHVLMVSPSVFTVLRISPEGDQHVLTMTNVTGRECTVEIPCSEMGVQEKHWHDLLNGGEYILIDQQLCITLQPYEVVWLKPLNEIKG